MSFMKYPCHPAVACVRFSPIFFFHSSSLWQQNLIYKTRKLSLHRSQILCDWPNVSAIHGAVLSTSTTTDMFAGCDAVVSKTLTHQIHIYLDNSMRWDVSQTWEHFKSCWIIGRFYGLFWAWFRANFAPDYGRCQDLIWGERKLRRVW